MKCRRQQQGLKEKRTGELKGTGPGHSSGPTASHYQWGIHISVSQVFSAQILTQSGTRNQTYTTTLSSHSGQERVRLRRDNYGAPRQLSVPDVVGEGEGGGGGGEEDEEEEEEEEARRRAERVAQHQEQCSGEHTEFYVNTLV
ncbi:unnamed protein product [Pleuronectes platessa]|uniref:Uncharacterized protein n=1 Tax=Pleuronectes platessa TaxID=8262 RepID=A0A9N7YTZ8_PLEPL|nr:unnamed protein product [Pleuronectes platessa]